MLPPVPADGVTVREFEVKFAVTVVAALSVTVQFPAPEHPPPHPVKLLPEFGVAVRVTDAPELYGAEHVPPQLMPAGALLTVPSPVPVLFTVNAYCPAGV